MYSSAKISDQYLKLARILLVVNSVVVTRNFVDKKEAHIRIQELIENFNQKRNVSMSKVKETREFKMLFSLIWRYKTRVIIGLLALLLVDGTQLILPLIIRSTINILTLGTATNSILARYAFYIIALSLSGAMLRFVWRYFIGGTSRKIEQYLRNKFFSHIQTLSASFFNSTRTGDLMARATNDVEAVRRAAAIGVIISVDSFIFLIFSLTVMIFINPKLTLYVASPFFIVVLIMVIFGRRIHQRFKRVQEAFSDIMEKVRESLSGIREIKAFVQEGGEMDNFKKINEEFFRKNISLVKVWGLFESLLMLLGGLATALVLLFGGRETILGEISIGDLVAFSMYLGMLTGPIMAIGWMVNLFQRGAASMGRINRILITQPEIKNEKDAFDIKIQGKIEYRNLFFSYSGRDSPVLKNINLLIQPGVRLGIVGRIGSGKSALVHLLCRVFEPPRGTLFLDGMDIKQIRLSILRQSIGMVPQDSFLFSTSILENIAFGNPEASKERVIEIAKLCGVYSEIMEFPEGFNTVVGERGISLSGGQKQRIALARAIIRNPKILILDDALSSVDAQTEEQVLKNLTKVMQNRTSIVISHRIVAVENCDFIIAMDNGRIVEQGNHEQLLNIKGIYAFFYDEQKLEEERKHLKL